jgi:uncharacterized integral membrane protein
VAWLKTLLLILIVIVLVIFSIQNQSEVTLRFIFPWENYQWFEIPMVPLPLFLVILCSIFLGVLIGGVGDLYKRFQLRKMLRQSQKTIGRLEREVQSLRGPSLGEPSFLKKEG